MTLRPGDSLGSYEVTGMLGAGGMGEVYRATDTRLGREVAIKVLPEALVGDQDHLSRMKREAQVLAQLHHPNIASIFGLEESDGTRALVMELVEGPTLADRLTSGPLAVDDALAIALQVARALEEAHEKGIVHRDLKPQNVKASLDGTVKVLDFGLAKAVDPLRAVSGAASPSGLANSPTLTLGATAHGVILGTAAYMAPEQAKGLPVDRRADIWAFGVVLWEMLTGRRLFGGDTVAETLAGVIRGDIDLGALPAATPAPIRRLLARCLERDPRRRLRDIGEARVTLEQPAEDAVTPAPAAAPARPRHRWREAAAWAVAVAAAAVAAWALWRPAAGAAAPATSAARLHLLPPAEGFFGAIDGPVMLSPDGSAITFRLERPDGQNLLAVRRLDSFEIVGLPGSNGGYEPFWSPDGRWLAYFDRHLSVIDPEGLQAPRHLAKVNDARGGAWGPDGTILFAPEPGSAILRVDAAGGGEPHAVTRLDASRGEVGHLRPQWIDDERFLYLVKSDRPETEGLYVGSLDGSLKKRLLPVGTAARFAPPDLLLLLQGDRLVARRLELATLEVAPEAWAIADGVDYNPGFDLLPVSSSATGRLVFHPPSKQEVRQLLRVDRAGATLATLGEPGDLNLDLSPDGQRLATQRFDDDRRPAIWIRDLARDATSVLTREVGAEGPVWSPDGRRIAYSVSEAAESRLVVRPAAGGAPLVELRLPYLQEPVDWSPDGRWILAEVGSPGERLNLVLVATGGSGEVTRYVATAASEHSGRFSPDGRFVAYVSDETGRQQVYVEPMPRSGARWVVSPRAGAAPRWSAEGRELLYTEPVGRGDAVTLMSVAVTRAGDDLALGQATPLGPLPSPDYEPVPGGRELLVGSPVEQGEPRPPVLIEGWTALVPRR